MQMDTQLPDVETVFDSENMTQSPSKPGKGFHFWIVIGAICSSLFLGALELTAVSTALPTIVDSIPNFPPTDFVWVGSAYALAGAAFLPMSGSFAQIFGRRPVMLFSLVMFGTGSVMCGAAKSRSLFIAGRTIQGLGGGGILSLTNIILADLVPLQERGVYNGLIGVTWSVAAAIGPVIGGALASSGQWRWLFYLNLPICGIVLVFVGLFLRLPTPTTSFKEKISQFDWIGMFLIIAGCCACIIALTWGGITFAWTSAQVLAPLCVGIFGILMFTLFEWRISSNPIVPSILLSNRTTLSGYLQTFIIQAVLVSFIYYMPVYFQACKGASPTGSGVDLFGLAMTLSPISIIGGVSITVFNCYRPQLWFGWSLTVLAMGVISTLDSTSPRAMSIGFEVLAGAGMGIAYTGTFFPVLAPLSVESNAHAIGLGIFLRSFAQVWGITICGTVLQNELQANLPLEFFELVPDSHALAYGAIAKVHSLPSPLRELVEEAFATSLKKVWLTLLGMSASGLLVSFAMRSYQLHTNLDKRWGVKQEEPNADEESAGKGSKE
ncbi:hypothetical protein CVT25_001489 [Psilocybe cyanescens]|uniref:Major facilitator superfamily (MFS) profile domain-containing protein n=1 Tax=Psilocybe cyanescens TaxID=93625 RepID=A0A409WNJ8_PSICY|nr:hypothetical protein CVT25_001489 [Psilocybe cyanescens]